jgi:hypothetical protein
MILKVFLTRKILGGIFGQYFLERIRGGSLGKYLGSISGNNLRGSLEKHL